MKKIASGINIMETTRLLAERPWKRLCLFVGENYKSDGVMLGLDYSGIFNIISLKGDVPITEAMPFHLADKHILAKFDIYESDVRILDGKITEK